MVDEHASFFVAFGGKRFHQAEAITLAVSGSFEIDVFGKKTVFAVVTTACRVPRVQMTTIFA